MKRINFWFWGLAVVVLTNACSPCAKLSKSKNIDDLDSAAVCFFEHKQYDRAHYIFEDLLARYSAKDRYHEIYNYYVTCKYKMGDLLGATFYYNEYASRYPSSKFTKEYAYMDAYCTYLLSDPHELDQRYTYMAIEKFQIYLGRFPNSEKAADAEKYIIELTEKLARKSFEQARLYYKIGHYKAAVQAFQNMLDQFPDSKLREEAAWLQVTSAVNLARVSIDTKKRLRYTEVTEYFRRFDEKFPGSKFADDAASLRKAAEKEYKNFLERDKARQEEKLYLNMKNNAQVAQNASTTADWEKAYNAAVRNNEDLKVLNPQSKYLTRMATLLRKLDAARKPL